MSIGQRLTITLVKSGSHLQTLANRNLCWAQRLLRVKPRPPGCGQICPYDMVASVICISDPYETRICPTRLKRRVKLRMTSAFKGRMSKKHLWSPRSKQHKRGSFCERLSAPTLDIAQPKGHPKPADWVSAWPSGRKMSKAAGKTTVLAVPSISILSTRPSFYKKNT